MLLHGFTLLLACFVCVLLFLLFIRVKVPLSDDEGYNL